MIVAHHPYLRRQHTLSPLEARFVSYVNVTLTFEARRLAKRSRIRAQHQVPLPDNVDRRGDMYGFLVSTGLDEMLIAEKSLADVISDDQLQQAVHSLTAGQQEILYRLIVLGQVEREVAQCLRISQQAVNKSKNGALAKLRAFLGIAS